MWRPDARHRAAGQHEYNDDGDDDRPQWQSYDARYSAQCEGRPRFGRLTWHETVIADFNRRREREVERWESFLDPKRNAVERQHTTISPRQRQRRRDAGDHRDHQQRYANANA